MLGHVDVATAIALDELHQRDDALHGRDFAPDNVAQVAAYFAGQIRGLVPALAAP